jgi:hypothetical protein
MIAMPLVFFFFSHILPRRLVGVEAGLECITRAKHARLAA